MKLYLYCKFEDAIAILKGKYLRLSIPNKMNDPFELLAQTEMKVLRNDFDKEMAQGRLRKIFYRNLQNAGYLGSYGMFQKELQKYPDYFFGIYEKEVPKSYSEFIKGFLNLVSSKWGFLCMSKTNASILMWSHYSDKHRGIVLEFDTVKMNIEDKYLEPVDYSSKRIKFTPSIDPNHELNDREWGKVLRRKHIDWEYENEVRITGGLIESKPNGDFPIEFPAEAVEGIFIGWKCERGEEIKEESMKLGYRTNMYKMVPHSTEFSLVAVPFLKKDDL